MSRALEVRRLLRRHRSGVLSSHSRRYPGYPYGAALPHVTDHGGRPILLISHLAEHTQNIGDDPRVSFTVCDSGAELQSAPRATLLGEAHLLPDDPGIAQRYLRLYPRHQDYLQIGGFHFYVIAVRQIRFIQGFGGLHWIAGESCLAPDTLAAAEADILEHMNTGHVTSMHDYARLAGRPNARVVEMAAIDCDGFDLRCDASLIRFDFDAPATTAGEVRAALIELARRARAA